MSGGQKIASAVALHPPAHVKQDILPFANVDIRLAGASFLEFSSLFLPAHSGSACRDSRCIVSVWLHVGSVDLDSAVMLSLRFSTD